MTGPETDRPWSAPHTGAMEVGGRTRIPVLVGVLASLISAGSIFELNFWGVVFAVIASVLLVGTAETLTSNKRKEIA